MHKRIINFRPINSHKGDDIGRKILECIAEWGITNVMTITVDNASSNDKAINFLPKKLHKRYDEGKHFQIRCAAHVLNLIVKDGLDECSNSVDTVRNTIRYIKLSTQRIEKFKDCIKDSRITTNRFSIGDCLTRWNSTHDMLKVACELKRAFELYDVENSSFSNDLDKVPDASDFRICGDLVNFLEKFKSKTQNVSASSRPLSHLFFSEIIDVDTHIRKWGVKPGYVSMVHEMRLKYDKYWGNW